MHTANPYRRLGRGLLETILFCITLGIGWVGWAAYSSRKGQTPAMGLISLQVIDIESRRPAGRASLFLREIISKGLPLLIIWLLLMQVAHLEAVIALLVALPFGWLIVSFLWLTTYFREDGAAPWDLVLSTQVVDLEPVECDSGPLSPSQEQSVFQTSGDIW